MEKLNGKHILVMGATGGIGAALVKLLTSSGAVVYMAARSQAKLTALAEQVQIPSSRCFVVDAMHPVTIQDMASQLLSQIPQPDIIVNAAGIGIIKSLDNLTLDEFRQSLQVNLEASFVLVKSFLPAMKASGKGLIINVPGVLGKVPMAGAAAYCASKYGLVGMMQSIREELKRTEIRITNIFLGGVDSPFWDTIDLRVQREKMIQAEEAARSIWFLCQQPRSGVVSEMVLQPFNHQAI